MVCDVENLKVHRHYSTGSYTVKTEENSFCFPLSFEINTTMIESQNSVLALNTTNWTQDDERQNFVSPLAMASLKAHSITVFKPIKALCLKNHVWLTGPTDYRYYPKQRVVHLSRANHLSIMEHFHKSPVHARSGSTHAGFSKVIL